MPRMAATWAFHTAGQSGSQTSLVRTSRSGSGPVMLARLRVSSFWPSRVRLTKWMLHWRGPSGTTAVDRKAAAGTLGWVSVSRCCSTGWPAKRCATTRCATGSAKPSDNSSSSPGASRSLASSGTSSGDSALNCGSTSRSLRTCASSMALPATRTMSTTARTAISNVDIKRQQRRATRPGAIVRGLCGACARFRPCGPAAY